MNREPTSCNRYWGRRWIISWVACICFGGTLSLSVRGERVGAILLQFDISAQAANVSLNEYADVTGRSLLYPYDLLSKYQSNEVKGKYDAEQALDLLLKDTGLFVTISEKGNVIINTENSPGESQMKTQKRILASLMGFWVGATGTQMSFAQSGTLEEVVVTAQKRSQSVQDVPLAITAFTGESIEQLHIREFTDIFLYTPGLVSAPNYATSERTAVRGLGSATFSFGFDPHVGIFVNGIHQGRGGAQTSTLFDVARVEVVKGPVGALYGRSAIAGAINIINNEPTDEVGGKVDLGMGERNRFNATGVINVPLTENLFFRGGVHVESEDGFIENVATGDTLGDTDATAFRAALRYSGEVVDAKLTFNYEDRTDATNIYQPTSGLESEYFGYPLSDYTLTPADPGLLGPFGDRYVVATDLKPENPIEIYDVVADITFELSEDWSMQSLTSYRDVDNVYREDFDGNAIADLTYFGPFDQNQENRHIQQEFQFSYLPEDGWAWIFGTSYYDEEIYGFIGSGWSETLNYGLNDTTQIQEEFGETNGDYNGWSVYGDVTIGVTDALELTVGARYSYDEKELSQYVPNPSNLDIFPNNTAEAIPFNWPAAASFPVTSKKDWDDVTLRAALNYALGNDANIYVSWAEGYKAGAIDALSFEAPVPFPPFAGVDIAPLGGYPAIADPESSDSFELGFKAQFLDNSLHTNTAIFYYEFEDQQQLVSQGASFVVKNVGKVEGSGFETELRYLPNARWDISLSAAYLDTEIKEDEISPENVGSGTTRAPKWSGSGIVTYTFPVSWGGTMFVNASHSYQDEMIVGGGGATVPSFNLTNASIGYDSETSNWGVSVYVENLTDEFIYFHQITSNGFGNSILDLRSNIAQPRTYGAELYYQF